MSEGEGRELSSLRVKGIGKGEKEGAGTGRKWKEWRERVEGEGGGRGWRKRVKGEGGG